MKKLFLQNVILIVSSLFITSSLVAQSPQGIPYQAVMRNADGSVMASSAVSLTFMIHDGSATGTVVYQESHSLSSNAQGLVSCIVGNGVVSQGNFSNINWGSGAKFLHVMMGSTDLGTQQMLSVPYALYASRVGVRVSATGDTLMIGNNGVVVPGVSSLNGADYNRTCFYFHGGGNQFPGTNNMTAPTVLYKLPAVGSPGFYQTPSLSETMTAMILANSEGDPNPTPGFPTVIKSFTIPSGQTISQAGTSVSWSYPEISVANYYYIAIPKNAPPFSNYYLEDLSANYQELYLRSVSGATRAVEKKDFTYDSKDYTLYRLGEAASTLSINYSFNTP